MVSKTFVLAIFISLFSCNAAVTCDVKDYEARTCGACAGGTSVLFSEAGKTCAQCLSMCHQYGNGCVAFVHNDTQSCIGLRSFEENSASIFPGKCFVKQGVPRQACPLLPPATTTTIMAETIPTFFENGCGRNPDFQGNHTFCNCADFNITNQTECDVAGGQYFTKLGSLNTIASEWCQFEFVTQKSPKKTPKRIKKWCNVRHLRQTIYLLFFFFCSCHLTNNARLGTVNRSNNC
eukprot:m.297733 g.297733  ORF g.297733 m.297733 type:complete len:235 (-) comp16403_c4_seq10:2136-2840(-)